MIRYIKESKNIDKLFFNPTETIADFLDFLTHIRCKAFFMKCLIFARKSYKQYLCIHEFIF